MSCPRKVVADILNNCIRPVRGIKPLAYWAYRSDVTFTYSANQITAIDTIALGSFESVKFGLNAGHDLATSDIADDGYKHKFSGVFNVAANADLDTMEDIVVFVQTNGGVWLCYGAKNGLWKETQVKMSNDNLSTIAVEFGSREGMEEEYSEYVVDGALLAAIPKTTEYEVITGLSLASGTVTPQVVYLQVDIDKDCKVILPDNTVLTSTAGIINTTWTGAAGAVTLLVPNNSAILRLTDESVSIFSAFVGNLNTVIIGNIYCGSNSNLTSISAQNATTISAEGCESLTSISAQDATTISAAYCPNLTSISAQNATTISAEGCALTAVAIAAQLSATVANIADLSTVTINFSGGTSAAYSTWSAQAQADAQTIITAGGAVTYTA